MGWFHGIYTTARMLFGRREGKGGHTFFSDHHADVDSSYAWTVGNWRAHSLFDALLMMNARKRRWQGDLLACFSFFVKFFFFSEDAS
jgi:hypothetical protein